MAMPIYFRYGDANFMAMSTIGGRIRELRKGKDLTQTDLGKRVGVDQSTISDIEKGASTKPEVFLAICEELQTTPEYLVRAETRDIDGENQVLAIYRSLDSVQRVSMIAMADGLKRMGEKSESGGFDPAAADGSQKKKRA